MRCQSTIKWTALWLLLVFAITQSGCVPATSRKITPELTLRTETDKILLMPVDVKLSTLTAGGMLEPNAEWTETAMQLIEESIANKLAPDNIELISNKSTSVQAFTPDQSDFRTQLIKLHEAVGQTILTHNYNPAFKLPSKDEKFDWTLGPASNLLKEKFGTDYALFVFVRDSYASAGRAAAIVLAAAFGVGVPGGSQYGFASLVDLNTGDIVWFNRLFRGAGDLRNPKGATETIDILLTEFPI